MKNRLIKIFSCVFFVLFIGAVLAGLILVIQFKRIEKEEYAILVPDSITVYVGEPYVLNPYLAGEDGRILESRFDFTTDSEGISVTSAGVITANSAPEGGATVTVFEKNTGLSTTVYVHIVDKLDYVKGIVFADNGTQYEVNSSSEFTLEYGKTYSIKFVTEPQNVKIEDYCTVLTDKADGIFDLTYDGNIVYLKAIGLGAGVQCVEVINDLNAKLFEMRFGFVINMRHKALGDDVLKSLDKKLISGKQIESAESLTISLDKFDLDDLNDFKSLNTLVFAANSVVSCENIRDDLCYRIKANLLKNYDSFALWKQYIDLVIPYEGDNLTDRFIILHNEKSTADCPALTYIKVDENTALPVYEFIGFTNTGWQKSNGSLFTDKNINSVKVGVHIYAVWSNIEFTIKFHVQGGEDTDFVCVKEQNWVYGDDDYLIAFEDLEKVKTGYLFEKWHDAVKEKDYGDAESCLELDVSGNNPEINLYCIWRPIKYIVYLSSSVEGTKITDENGDDVESLKLMYDVEYTLPEAECTGYTFVCWKVLGEDVTYGRQIINLCEHEDDGISLEAQFTENEYNLYIFTSDNEDNKAYLRDEDGAITYVTAFESVKLKYTQVFDLSVLPVLYNDAYDTYNWKCGVGWEYAVDAKISKLASENNGYAQIFAVWTNAHAYTITYNLNGGTSPFDGTTTLSNGSFWFKDASYPKAAHKFGSEFLGWDYKGETYGTYSIVTGKGLNLNRFSDTVVFTAKWREEAGTQQDPYCISSKYLLRELADKVNDGNNFKGKYLKLTNDIEDVGEFTPIGNNNGDTYYSGATAAVNRRFAGTFDGGNKTISGYSVTAKSGTKGDTYAGLFGYIAAEGTVQNLNVSGIKIEGKSTRSSGSKGGSHHGGIAGVCSGKILSCTVNGSVSGEATLDTHHGGIVGYIFLKGTVISDCKNNAVVDGTAGRCNSHGGIVGSVNNGVVYNCQNSGTIRGTNGGTGSYSNRVKGYAFFGGIAGVACAVIVNCNNTVSNNVAGGGWSFNGTANSGSGAIVGYLHNGSDANTDSTNDDTLTIDKTQYGGYYSAVVNCGAKNTLIGFVQNDTGNNKKPVALHFNATIAPSRYRSLSGNAPTAIAATYYDSYLNSTAAVNEMFKTSALIVPAAYIMTAENSANGATHEWDDHVDLPQDATAYIILGVGSTLGILGLAILTVALVKLKKKRNQNEG